jgi:hypothetical protein
MVALDFFSFFLWNWLFLTILYFGAKLLALELCDFLTFFFFLLGYPSGLIKLTQVSLHFLIQYFFYLTSIFFARLFFWKSMFLSWPHVVSGESVKLTRVDSIFFSIYYDFFFQFHHFALNYFSLSFVIFFALSFFSLLFLVCYFERGLVKLTRISLHFCSQCFFILNSCRMWRVNWVNPSWLGFFSLDFLLRFFFNFIILH